MESYLSFCLLDGPRNSRCALLGHVHICAPRINFWEVAKNRERRCQTIRDHFSYFAKKLRMGKPDGKLLEMLLEKIEN